MSEYKVYKVAPLTGALMFSNLVAVFYDLDLAKDFVNYQLAPSGALVLLVLFPMRDLLRIRI